MIKKLILFVVGSIVVLTTLIYIPGIIGRYALVGIQEQATLGNLNQLRFYIKIYKEDTGKLPRDPRNELIPKYMAQIPKVSLNPKHHFWESQTMDYVSRLTPTDTGHWEYVSDPASKDFGKVFVNCSHQNERGDTWNTQ